MSAFLLLGIGITFSGLLLLFEHCYFKYLRKYLARFQNTAWVQLISIDVAESLERTRQNNKMEGNYKNNQSIGENEIDECANALDTELDEADEPDNGKFLGYARPTGRRILLYCRLIISSGGPPFCILKYRFCKK